MLTEEIGLEEEWDLYPSYFEEGDMVKNRGEGEGPPEVSQEHLDQLDAEAALEEIKKLHDLDVIMPVAPDPSAIPVESLVDTTLVKDWRFRNGQWRRRCRIVASLWTNHRGKLQPYKYVLISSASTSAIYAVWISNHCT